MGEFPIFQLLTLLARQASVPIATKIKEYARVHPLFSRHVCMRTGRVFRSAQLRLQLWSLALQPPRHAPHLSDAAALDYGAELLGEAVIFLLGALIIISEVNRQAYNKHLKGMDHKSQWMAVMLQLEELQRELTLQQQDLDRLADELRRLAPHMFPPAPAPAPVATTDTTTGQPPAATAPLPDQLTPETSKFSTIPSDSFRLPLQT